jgi:hypothetical protein
MKGKRLWFVAGAAALAVALFFLLRGKGIRMRTVHRIRALLHHDEAIEEGAAGAFSNVIFLHHSVGRYLIEQGGVRERLSEAGYRFWDHDYNYIGITDPSGVLTGYSYGVPDDNTNPDGLAALFAQPLHELPLNAFSGLMQHEVILFKSCFPVSNIRSDEQLEQYKRWYLAMREVMDAHPDHLFIVITPPPLNPSATTPEAAARARAFADWLLSDEYLEGHPNVATFDLFGALAEDDPASPEVNMLRADYRRDGEDSHPNETANREVGPRLADFIIHTAEHYRATWGNGQE